MSSLFDQQSLGASQSRFKAFANLLSLRNGGQIVESDRRLTALSTHGEEHDDEGDDFDEDISEAATDRAVPLAISQPVYLKNKFLDRLAEVVSRERHSRNRGTQPNVTKSSGPEPSESFVAATTMREDEDHVKIFVTRNGGLDELDQTLFRRMENLFAKIGRQSSESMSVMSWISRLLPCPIDLGTC